MPCHPKEHPLAHRIVVPNGFLLIGETVRVLDWLDRCGVMLGAHVAPGARVAVQLGSLRLDAAWSGEVPIDVNDAVAVVGRLSSVGAIILHHSELPNYDPVPVGYIS